jgi:hypothetical protein
MSFFHSLLNDPAIHPTFIAFIDTFFVRSSQTPFHASAKLEVLYSVAHSITYMTASFLKVAAFQLTPSSLKSLSFYSCFEMGSWTSFS